MEIVIMLIFIALIIINNIANKNKYVDIERYINYTIYMNNRLDALQEEISLLTDIILTNEKENI